MALPGDIFSGIKAMPDQDLDHAEQDNLIQASAVFVHKKFVSSDTELPKKHTPMSPHPTDRVTLPARSTAWPPWPAAHTAPAP
jgi:hypothetical protein